MATTEAADLVRLVGTKVRARRRVQGLTLKDISAMTGLSSSMLSMLERGVANASVGTLVSVASALGVHMAELFEDVGSAPEEPAPVLRHADQKVLVGKQGARRRMLVSQTDAGLELALNEYDGHGGASGAVRTRHAGREVGLLLEGRLEVDVEGVTHQLGPGDVIAYDSTRPHRISNPGTTPARAVWLNIDPA